MKTKEKQKSIFPRKNIKKERFLSILRLIIDLIVSVSLVYMLNHMTDWLSRLVPSTEEWTLVIMIIPLTLFGIYISLYSANFQNNKEKVICGDSYALIRKSYLINSSWIHAFKLNGVVMLSTLLLSLIIQDYPMIVGTALVLCVDLAVLIGLELLYTRKTISELYKYQFSRGFKVIEEMFFFSDEQLSELERGILDNDWLSVDDLLNKKVCFEEYLEILYYELELLPKDVVTRIGIDYMRAFSFSPKQIENYLLYKKHIDNVIFLSSQIKEFDNEKGLEKIILALGEEWINNLHKIILFRTKRLKRFNVLHKKKRKSLLQYVKEIGRSRICYYLLLEQYNIISQCINQCNDFPKKQSKFENDAKIWLDGLKEIDESHEKFLQLARKILKEAKGL